LITQASATLGDPISYTAALSGATSDATGDITLKVYGPFDPTTDPTTDQCIDSGTDANLVTTLGPFPIGSPDANGDYVVSSDDPADTTDDFAPTQADRYQWVASYSGDTNNEAVSSECNADSEQSTVSDTSSTTATEQNMPLAAKTGDATKLTQGNKDPDITNGTDQSDTIAGGGGRDLIRGLLSSDKLNGDNGGDTLYGNADDDFLQGGVGRDAIHGGPGDDYIDGVDGKAANDEIDGGLGADYCVGDEGDTFTNCDGNVVKVTVPVEATAQKEANH
jgi:Ca2+-binding RTX toxin-like protein